MNKIKSVGDAYEYLNAIYPGTRALDLGGITIDAGEDEVREAEKDVLITAVEMDDTLLLGVKVITAVEMDDTLLLGVKEALTTIIHEVKQDLAASASDAAWVCYHEGVLPDERVWITKVTFGRKPNLEEVTYWREMFDTEYEIVSKEAA
jgi:hypothetical protein